MEEAAVGLLLGAMFGIIAALPAAILIVHGPGPGGHGRDAGVCPAVDAAVGGRAVGSDSAPVRSRQLTLKKCSKISLSPLLENSTFYLVI